MMTSSQVYGCKEAILHALYTDGLRKRKRGLKAEAEINVAKVFIFHAPNQKTKFLISARSRYQVACVAITFVGQPRARLLWEVMWKTGPLQSVEEWLSQSY